MELFNLELIGGVLLQVLQLKILLWILLGVFVGIVFGAIPGLTATTAVALFTPITFGLGFNESFGFLLGIYCGGYYAGSIPAILIRTPGAPGNAATTLDGYPLAQQGRASEALMYSVFSSWIGGTFSALCLFLFAPLISSIALKFGPQEYFAVAILGFTAIASISGKSVYKGIVSGMIGMIIGFIGMDPIDGAPRYTFGILNLMGGVELTPALIGLFAVSEVLLKSEAIGKVNEVIATQVGRVMPDLKVYWNNKWLVFKSALIGTIIGAIPGTGSAIASWLSYNEAKRSSKHPEEFGKGSIEGIIACETSNNAVSGGAMVPLITLGIPGDTVTAILLVALVIQGFTPGPTLITEKFDVVSIMLFILIIANFFMMIMGLFGAPYFAKILKLPSKIMVPIILVLCVAGSFGSGNSMFDVRLAMVLGVLGFVATKFGFPIPPMVLGLVLGPIIEPNFRLALISSEMDPTIFVRSPLSAMFLALTVIITINLYKRNKSMDKSLEKTADILEK